MPLRVLIADDEPIARERLRLLLGDEPDVEIMGAAASGLEAVRLIHRHDPDLVLLDIQMPDGNGFDVIERIGQERMPDVVFVTAYDDYAVRAFEVHAVDYLLKPFDQERLAAALARVRERRDGEAAAARAARLESITGLLAERAEAGNRSGSRRLVVRDGDRVRFIDTDAITWIESAGNYVRVHTDDESCIVRHTLTRMEERLDPDRFALHPPLRAGEPRPRRRDAPLVVRAVHRRAGRWHHAPAQPDLPRRHPRAVRRGRSPLRRNPAPHGS